MLYTNIIIIKLYNIEVKLSSHTDLLICSIFFFDIILAISVY